LKVNIKVLKKLKAILTSFYQIYFVLKITFEKSKTKNLHQFQTDPMYSRFDFFKIKKKRMNRYFDPYSHFVN